MVIVASIWGHEWAAMANNNLKPSDIISYQIYAGIYPWVSQSPESSQSQPTASCPGHQAHSFPKGCHLLPIGHANPFRADQGPARYHWYFCPLVPTVRAKFVRCGSCPPSLMGLGTQDGPTFRLSPGGPQFLGVRPSLSLSQSFPLGQWQSQKEIPLLPQEAGVD